MIKCRTALYGQDPRLFNTTYIFLLSDFLISVARPKTSIKISIFTLFLDLVAFQPRCLLAGQAELLVFENTTFDLVSDEKRKQLHTYLCFQSPFPKECFDIKELSLKGHHNKLHSTQYTYVLHMYLPAE